jgi:hypothetical protein
MIAFLWNRCITPIGMAGCPEVMRDFFILSLRSLAIEIRCLAMVAPAFVLTAAPLLATTRTVNNLNDASPESLRQRISESAANDTINFSVTGTPRSFGGPCRRRLLRDHRTLKFFHEAYHFCGMKAARCCSHLCTSALGRWPRLPSNLYFLLSSTVTLVRFCPLGCSHGPETSPA